MMNETTQVIRGESLAVWAKRLPIVGTNLLPCHERWNEAIRIAQAAELLAV